ncbi:MAG: LysM peptidoglycan-binding domain-containing protein [Anaerolineae bacterium]
MKRFNGRYSFPGILAIIALATVVMAAVVIALARPRQVAQERGALPTPLPPTATASPTTSPTATPLPTPTPTVTATPLPQAIIHTIEMGDSLLALAIEYGTTVEAIMEANNLEDQEMIWIGQELVIPLPTATPLSAEAGPKGTATPEQVVHVVKRGDSLLSIAIEYDVSVEAIMEANDLEYQEMIWVGQELVIPTPTYVLTPTLVPPEATSEPEATATPEQVVHVVGEGDSLLSIAIQYGITVHAIMVANDLTDPEFVRIGQRLIIPSPTPTPQPTATPLPTSTPTPGPPYPAPSLLYPPEGHAFRGPTARVVLNWTSVGILADDEWYVLRLRHPGDGELQTTSIWTKATSFRLPTDLYPPPAAKSHLFKWDVTMVRQMGERPDGTREGEALSPMSTTRRFYWY